MRIDGQQGQFFTGQTAYCAATQTGDMQAKLTDKTQENREQNFMMCWVGIGRNVIRRGRGWRLSQTGRHRRRAGRALFP
jgi:hypothetical protein